MTVARLSRARSDIDGVDSEPRSHQERYRGHWFQNGRNAGQEATTGDLSFRVLGPIEVTHADEQIDLGGNKPRALLAALLVRSGETATVDWLSDVLWGESLPPTAAKTIQKYVSRLRKDLGKAITTRPGGYSVAVPDDSLDAVRFESLIGRATAAASNDEGVRLIEEALSLWRSDPYPELRDSSIGISETARLNELRINANERLIEMRLKRGESASLIPPLEELTLEHPLHERFWFQMMLALYRSGRQSEALRAFQRLRSVLGEELGIEPSTEVRGLEEQILVQDPRLDRPPKPHRKTNLGDSLTSFIGRAQEVNKLVQLAGEHRLITLLGAAGSGKTRLAREFGHRFASSRSDGVWFIDLAPITSPDLVANAMASPFGVSGTDARTIEEVLVDYLADRDMLLIVDNCEHLIDRVALVIQRLLENSTSLTILTTSRQRIGVPGELVFAVKPLSCPPLEAEEVESFEAVELFLDRARLANPEFDPDRVDLDHIAEICRRLDGMPLGIELASARARSVPPAELRRHLDDRFSLLKSATKTDPGRHETLRAAIDWSYQLLGEAEKIVFLRLSVFLGGFDLDSAQAVCSFAPLTTTDVLASVPELVDRSLVSIAQPAGEKTRYLLLETMRQFGQDELDGTELRSLRNAHADYFCDFAERAFELMKGRDQQMILASVKAEHDNLLKAMRWASTTDRERMVRMATALERYWDTVGPRSEGHEWLRRAVEVSSTVDDALRVDVLVAASDIFSSAHASTPVELARDALEAARSLGDDLREARALRALGWALALREEPEEAIRVLQDALPVFEAADDRWETALTLERLGQAAYVQPEWAIEHLERALPMFRESGDRIREGLVLIKLADRMSQMRVDLDTALEYARQAVAICDEAGSVLDAAHARLDLGRLLRRAGHPAEAAEVLGIALDQLGRSGDERCSVRALTAMGTSLIEVGRTPEGAEALEAGLRRSSALDERRTSRVALAGTARLVTDESPSMATRLYSYTEKLSRELNMPSTREGTDRREATYGDLESRLGRSDYEEAWQLGQSMNFSEAVELALGVLPRARLEPGIRS